MIKGLFDGTEEMILFKGHVIIRTKVQGGGNKFDSRLQLRINYKYKFFPLYEEIVKTMQ